jgi:hypothetical protein
MGTETTPPGPPEAASPREPTSIRFHAALAVDAQRAATSDGASLGEWVAGLVEQEIRRRNGRCMACGAERTGT